MSEGKHPAVALLEFFKHDHLPSHLAAVSAPCADLAAEVMGLVGIDGGAELTAGLRKLLEAKDCFVRAVLVAKRR